MARHRSSCGPSVAFVAGRAGAGARWSASAVGPGSGWRVPEAGWRPPHAPWRPGAGRRALQDDCVVARATDIRHARSGPGRQRRPPPAARAAARRTAPWRPARRRPCAPEARRGPRGCGRSWFRVLLPPFDSSGEGLDTKARCASWTVSTAPCLCKYFNRYVRYLQ
jgi:hypothetical protein